MKTGDKYTMANGAVIRVIGQTEGRPMAVVIDCSRMGSMPFLIPVDVLESMPVTENEVIFHNDDEWETWQLTERDKRYEIIRELAENRDFENKALRSKMMKSAAERYRVTTRTVRNYLWQYYAGGGKSAMIPARRDRQKTELSETQKDMRWALNAFYYTAEKNSIVYAYKQMLLHRYMDGNGEIRKDAPTLSQFRYFYQTNRKHINEIISRNGLSYYQRNARPIPGDIKDFANDIGTYMTDATVADIYLVNRVTRKTIGRPNIYIMVDAYTSLVTGIYVGFDGGETALRLLLINVCSNKVEFCKKHGIEIKAEEWPSEHLPTRIITDRGHEFMSAAVVGLCEEHDITIEHLPAYRPELKGPVEKMFDLLQQSYKSVLASKGVIRPDFAERGAPDYRNMAVLDIEEFRKIVIKAVIYYNAKHMTAGFKRTQEMMANDIPKIPAALWAWQMEHGSGLKKVDRSSFVLAMLPREQGKITRRGLVFHKRRYYNEGFKERFVRSAQKGAETVTVAYFPEDMDKVWVLEKGTYYRFDPVNNEYDHLSDLEILDIAKNESDAERALSQNSLREELSLMGDIHRIAAAAQTVTEATRDPVPAKAKVPKRRHKQTVMDILREEMEGDS